MTHEISLYNAAIPLIKQRLRAAHVLIRKAKEHAAHEDVDEQSLLDARLVSDMYDFKKQIQVVTDFAKSFPARITGTLPETWDDSETSFEALSERISKAEALVSGCTPDQVNGRADSIISMELPMGKMDMSGEQYLFMFIIPNILFHLSAAHCILRNQGVNVGKLDFMGMT